MFENIQGMKWFLQPYVFVKNTGRQKTDSKYHVALLVTAPFLTEMSDKQLYALHQKKKQKNKKQKQKTTSIDFPH